MAGVILDAVHALLAAARPAVTMAAEVRDARVTALLEVIAGRGPETIEGQLARRFGLQPIELALLWLAAAPRFRPALADAYARAHDHLQREALDVVLADALLCGDDDERRALRHAIAADAPLVRSGLLRVQTSASWPRAELVASTSFVCLVDGRRALDESLEPVARIVIPELASDAIEDGARWQRELAPLLGGVLARPSLRHGAGLGFVAGVGVVLEGALGSGRLTIIKALSHALGRHLLVVDGASIAARADGEKLWRALVTEAVLFGDVVHVRDAEALIGAGAARAGLVARTLEEHALPLVCAVGGGTTLDAALEPVVLARHRLEARTSAETLTALWQTHAHAAALELAPGEAERLARRVVLSPLQVRKAVQRAAIEGRGEAALERAAVAQVPKEIGPMALVTEPQVTLDDIVLDAPTRETIGSIVAAVRNRRMILDDWRLGERITRGTGLVCLFDGPPGTGKTHAAEGIAHALGLSLLRVNIAGVVDKYIGETEKNLTRIFERARPDLSLLLFDEADSLFSKRTSDVERAADRHSNMDINVLLQLVERFEGISVLTTNLKNAIDPAFARRFSFKLAFALPEADERERIWRYLLAPIASDGSIDFAQLGDVTLSGGEIKNAVLRAAYRAAQHGERLTTHGLRLAAEAEAAAAGRIVRRSA